MTSLDWNSENVHAMLSSPSFTIDVFALRKFISNEQVSWEKDYLYRKFERLFHFFLFFLHVTQIVTC